MQRTITDEDKGIEASEDVANFYWVKPAIVAACNGVSGYSISFGILQSHLLLDMVRRIQRGHLQRVL